MPDENGIPTSLEKIQILNNHLPTRETMVKVGEMEVTLVNGQEAISVGIKKFELIQEKGNPFFGFLLSIYSGSCLIGIIVENGLLGMMV